MLFRPKKTKKENDELSWSGHHTHNKSFATVAIDAAKKRELEHDIDSFLGAEEWYKTMGLSYKLGYMLHGPPGTGKTSIVLAISNRARYHIYSMDLSKFSCDAELEEAFEKLPERCMVLLEDVDCMTHVVKRRDAPENEHAALNDDVSPLSSNRLTLSAILNAIDGAGSNHGRIFVMTTNHLDELDPALVRSGRVDMTVHLGLCTHDQIRAMFDIYYGPQADREADEVCAAIPEGKISPARVSCVMQHHASDSFRASRALIESAAKNANVQL